MTIKVPQILIPNDKIDLEKWSVVACDQFTSQPEYWSELETLVGEKYSTLKMIFPEVYLEKEDKKQRTSNINNTMDKYLKEDIFKEVNDFVLVDRTQNDGMHRIGLMLSVDLEDYDYTPKNNALIKATEKTVVERLPARIEVREHASLEIPHIMLLMDDVNNVILKKLMDKKEKLEKLYDFDLNMNGGHLVGYRVDNSNEVLDELMSLLDNQKENKLLFVVGDGNHSLATAKECWNRVKATLSEEERQNHPARYALCELVNLRDQSLIFQPIHRVMFNCGKEFIEYMQNNITGEEKTKMVYEGETYELNISTSPSDAIADIQGTIDKYMKSHSDVNIDYVHNDDYTLKVAKENHGVAIFMPTISKDSLFDYVSRRGVLPRKSFSMGHAEDKRYYMEAKKIK